MEALVTQLGVGGIFAILPVREAAGIIKSRNGKNGGKLAGEVHQLHEWHKPDPTGRQEWKNPDMAQAIENLSKATVKQTEVLNTVVTELRAHSGRVRT